MKLFVAIPLLGESENVVTLLDDLRNQSYNDFEVRCCVNNPQLWYDEQSHGNYLADNAKTIELLSKVDDVDLRVIDKSSDGNALTGKKAGVGMARKIMMDDVVATAMPDDLIVSLDGDTRFNGGYFQSIVDNFLRHPAAAALSVPYYHPLSGNNILDDCMLRYEIYMRHYMINMLRINNPYAFTALGSAIALPVWAYKKVGGITPRLSGEDFYLLQSVRKTGKVLIWNEEAVYPQGRFSDRVNFGTGPAITKGAAGNWSSYPFYKEEYFNEVKETFDSFELLYENDVDTPMTQFLKSVFKTDDLWSPLRDNYKSKQQFVHACMVRVDALRILQYLRARQGDDIDCMPIFGTYEVTRDKLYDIENKMRRENS
ncbi:MAG: glycosyltransferase family 2 protein [Bacteroidales bacterium]|nr:glycosyltransferase family 2 protein [Bacteroidales bacterium]